MHCPNLAEEAIKAALEDYPSRNPKLEYTEGSCSQNESDI